MKDASRLAWRRISTADVERIRTALTASYAVGTTNRVLTAVRQVLQFCWRVGDLSWDEYKRLASVKPVQGTPAHRGRALTAAELGQLYEACARDTGPAGARDGAALALMHAAGLRCGEAVGLEMSDFTDQDAGELLVTGKGGARLAASLGAGAPWVHRWIARRGGDPGPLLCAVWSNGRIERRRLTAPAMWAVLAKRAREGGVSHCSPHDLRKTFATSLLRAGCDYLMVMRSLRHRDLRSVFIYDRRTDDERAAAQRAAIRVPSPGGPS